MLRRLLSHRGLSAAVGAAAGAWALPSACEQRSVTGAQHAPAAAAAAADAAAACAADAAAAQATDAEAQATGAPHAAAAAADALPIYSKAEVAKHTTPESGIWVVFQGDVYDITTFVQNHPGGIEKIMTAAGGEVEPYWSLYRQHLLPGAAGQEPKPKSHVAEILAPLLIGHVDPEELAAAAAAKKGRPADDPYADEPERHGALRLLSETPCSGESPQTLIFDNWLTPNALFFVRNHHPVPRLDPATYTLRVDGLGVTPRDFSLSDLEALPKAEVVATLQCGGNRRGDLDVHKRTSGNSWGAGAISNARWGGVYLRDVLRECGLTSPLRAGVEHVQFEGEDGTKASIPASKALSEYGDVLLAYEMNGEPLPADHGYPLRAVVPGHVGVRNIKWLRKVVASDEEAEGVWQRGIAYKSFGPNVTSLEGLDVAKAPAMQEMPVQSVIVSPVAHAALEPGEDTTLQGFAWSGGGRGITRVECSADDGRSWHTATLTEGADQPRERAWAWTFWECEVPLPTPASEGQEKGQETAPRDGPGSTSPAGGSGRQLTLMCRAVDASFNAQPADVAQVWNLRGLANNAWHRVPVVLEADDGEDS